MGNLFEYNFSPASGIISKETLADGTLRVVCDETVAPRSGALGQVGAAVPVAQHAVASHMFVAPPGTPQAVFPTRWQNDSTHDGVQAIKDWKDANPAYTGAIVVDGNTVVPGHAANLVIGVPLVRLSSLREDGWLVPESQATPIVTQSPTVAPKPADDITPATQDQVFTYDMPIGGLSFDTYGLKDHYATVLLTVPAGHVNPHPERLCSIGAVELPSGNPQNNQTAFRNDQVTIDGVVVIPFAPPPYGDRPERFFTVGASSPITGAEFNVNPGQTLKYDVRNTDGVLADLRFQVNGPNQ